MELTRRQSFVNPLEIPLIPSKPLRLCAGGLFKCHHFPRDIGPPPTEMVTVKTSKFLPIVAVLVAAVSFVSASTARAADDKNPVVLMKTSEGTLEITLDPAKAPVSVKNFLSYVDEKFYDGTLIYRDVKGFVAQGGGVQPHGRGKPEHPPIADEAKNGPAQYQGHDLMARTSDPNSATPSSSSISPTTSGSLDPQPDGRSQRLTPSSADHQGPGRARQDRSPRRHRPHGRPEQGRSPSSASAANRSVVAAAVRRWSVGSPRTSVAGGSLIFSLPEGFRENSPGPRARRSRATQNIHAIPPRLCMMGDTAVRRTMPEHKAANFRSISARKISRGSGTGRSSAASATASTSSRSSTSSSASSRACTSARTARRSPSSPCCPASCSRRSTAGPSTATPAAGSCFTPTSPAPRSRSPSSYLWFELHSLVAVYVIVFFMGAFNGLFIPARQGRAAADRSRG